MMYHHTKLPSAFYKKYINIQSCIMSTFMSINIVQLLRQTNPNNTKIVIAI